jgi:ribonucleotide monophosphatase NagD (HAD superfamily)
MIGRMDSLPPRVRLVIFDLDGVIYRGSQPVAGAVELVAWLHERRVAVR